MKKLDLSHVPNKPGVYLWKDKQGSIIYVGKARKLKTRMNQYIKGSINSYKTQKMMQVVVDFDYIISSSEKEALLLERNLINQHKPYFNIKLTDDKRYPYIQIQLLKNQLKINLSYRARKKGVNTLFFGPFPSGYGAKKMSDFLNRIFIFEKGLPIKNKNFEFWSKRFDEVKNIISHKKSLINVLKQKMQQAADDMQYEIAHDIKETLKAIKASQEKQVAEIDDKKTIDVIAFYEKSGYLAIEQLFYRQGVFLSSKQQVVEIITSLEETMRQFSAQYYTYNLEPKLIITNQVFETDIPLLTPQKGIKKQILNIALTNCQDNIEHKLAKFIRQEERTIGSLSKLKNLLNLPKLNHILMIDNSNFANANPISAIVSYRNGIKNKAEYRKLKLEETTRKADVEYMKQAITKYFVTRNHQKPDLLIVDGGKPQVNEVKKIIPDINIIGLVKDDKHRTRAIIDQDGNEKIINDVNLYNFLAEIQIEVDRFAKKTYQAKARKTTLEGMLKNISGVGQKIEEKLLDHFKSYAAIYNASIKDLEKVVSHKIALAIKKELNNYENITSSR